MVVLTENSFSIVVRGQNSIPSVFAEAQNAKQGQPQAAAPIYGITNPVGFRERHILLDLLELRNKRPEMVAHKAAVE